MFLILRDSASFFLSLSVPLLQFLIPVGQLLGLVVHGLSFMP